MTNALHPCPGCLRHILASETTCPFCSASLEGVAPRASRRLPKGRMSRAALLAFGTLAVNPALASCGGDTEGAGQGDGDGDNAGDGDGDNMGDGDGDNGQPVYGAPVTGGTDGAGGSLGGQGGMGGETSAGGTGGDQVGPVYGLPPIEPQ